MKSMSDFEPDLSHWKILINFVKMIKPNLLVLFLLLILAGDIEVNPGPINVFDLKTLSDELKALTEPIQFGVILGIPEHRLEFIRANHPNGMLD